MREIAVERLFAATDPITAIRGHATDRPPMIGIMGLNLRQPDAYNMLGLRWKPESSFWQAMFNGKVR